MNQEFLVKSLLDIREKYSKQFLVDITIQKVWEN